MQISETFILIFILILLHSSTWFGKHHQYENSLFDLMNNPLQLVESLIKSAGNNITVDIHWRLWHFNLHLFAFRNPHLNQWAPGTGINANMIVERTSVNYVQRVWRSFDFIIAIFLRCKSFVQKYLSMDLILLHKVWDHTCPRRYYVLNKHNGTFSGRIFVIAVF